MPKEEARVRILFAGYCISSYLFIGSLCLPPRVKAFLYARVLSHFLSTIEKKICNNASGFFDFAYSFIFVINRSHIFDPAKQELPLNVHFCPWSNRAYGHYPNINKHLACEISNFLPKEILLEKFHSSIREHQPCLQDFFEFQNDNIFSTPTTTVLHNFSVEGRTCFAYLIKLIGTFLFDMNSFLMITQMYAHGLAILAISSNSAKARDYLSKIDVFPSTGWGVGDLIVDYKMLNYFLPKLVAKHFRLRPDLKKIVRQVWF